MRLLTLARDLRRRKARERKALFVVEGVRAVEELVRSPLSIVGALVAPQLSDAPRGAALEDALRRGGIDVESVKDREFASAAETESPQGVLAMASIPERSVASLPSDGPLRVVVLDSVQDPGNVGTILRTAAALNAVVVALPGTVDLWNAKVVRAAMGAHFRHPAFHTALDQLVPFFKHTSVVVWGADAGADAITGVGAAPDRLALVVGNEGSGLSEQVREHVTRLVSIPMAGDIESLNVAVSTAILLYALRAGSAL